MSESAGGEETSSLHVAGSEGRHQLGWWGVACDPLSEEQCFISKASRSADLQRSFRCQQNRDLWTAGEGWRSNTSRMTPGPMQGASCVSLPPLASYSSAIDSKSDKISESRLPTSTFPNTLKQTWNTAFSFFPQLYSCPALTKTLYRYCRKQFKIAYKEKKDKRQWSF